MMPPPRSKTSRTGLLACVLLLAFAIAKAQQPEAPSLIEVNWHSSLVVPLDEVTAAVSQDDNICRVHLDGDRLQLTGLERGETIVFAWTGATRHTLRVQVVAPPPKISPSLVTRRFQPEFGSGTVSTSFLRTSSGGNSTSLLLDQFDWSQIANGRGIVMRAQTQSQFADSAHPFGVNSLSLQFFTPNSSASVGDFLLSSPLENESRATPAFTYNNVVLRGADVWVRRGNNRLEAFAGSTIPPYYLSLSGTRSMAGFSWTRKLGEGLFFSSTTGAVNAPRLSTIFERQTTPFQTAAFSFSRKSWKTEATIGGSTHGAMMQASASYMGTSGMAFATVTQSAAEFPLNQMQLFFTGGSSVSAGGSYHATTKIDLSGYFQHSTSPAIHSFGAASGNYLNPNLTFRVSSRHQLVFNYTYTTADQAALNSTVAHRVEIFANSSLGRGIANTAQVTIGRLHDRGELHSENDYAVRDVVTIPTHVGVLSFGFQHILTDPSLASRLAANLGLLTPEEREQMLIDPVGFAANVPLSPQTRLLLSAIQPSTTEATAGAQFSFRRRLSLSPMVRIAHENSNVVGISAFHVSFAYSAIFALRPDFSLQSSLSQVLDLSSTGALRRSNAITFGVRKGFRGRPTWLVSHHRPEIVGRICVDQNVDGRCQENEPGTPGVRVLLDERRIAFSDAQGIFRFTDVPEGEHRVSLSTAAMTVPMRFTSASDIPVDISQNNVSIQFSVVNFARVMGNVFNDYSMDGSRRPDAPGLSRVKLTLSTPAGFSRSIGSDGTGDFEMTEVPPGDYVLKIDPATVPPDYRAASLETPLHVDPVSTVVHDFAVQALRSMSGHILEQNNGATQPISGVRIRVGEQIVVTDETGQFLARNLPAGEVSVEVLPASGETPAGVRLPSGKVRLSREPQQLNNVRIVITDPAVLHAVTGQR